MSISNWFIKNINRLTVFLGIRHQTDTNKMPNSATATTYSQSDVVTNSGSQPVAYPTKPDDWQDAGKWEQYWNLRVKYPENFAAADIYIQTFTPLEVEMIMKHVHEERRFTISNDVIKKIIGDRVVNTKREFLIWWQNYKKADSTFEKEAELRKDGIGNLIDEYLTNKN